MYPALLACFHLPFRKRDKHSASEHCRCSLEEWKGISLRADKTTREGVCGGTKGLKEEQSEDIVAAVPEFCVGRSLGQA